MKDKQSVIMPHLQEINYKLIQPDPNQPRKTFSGPAMEELANSIQEQGILQPLILQHFGDLAAPFYRIVCGERRWRAAGMLNLPTVPALVYASLTEQQRFDFQFIENNQREAVSALEEANAIRQQLEDRKKTDMTFSPELLAKELGISRAAIYEKLKLTRLHPPLREALLAGQISVSVAGVIAIVPLPKQQEQLLKVIEERQKYGRVMSVRDVQEEVDDEYVKQLGDAPFKLNANLDGLIKTESGNSEEPLPICTDCPHRTGNMLTEFPELKSRPNVCTRPDCFAEKCKAHWMVVAKDEAQRGVTVLTEKDFKRVKGDYVDATRESWGLFDNCYTSPEKKLGKNAPEVTLVSTADGLKKFFKRTDIPEAAKKAKVKLTAEAKEKTQTPEEKAAAAIDLAAADDLRKRQETYLESQWPELGQRLVKLKSEEALDIIWELLQQADGYYDDDKEKKLAGKSKDPQVQILARLFADGSNDPLTHSGWNGDGIKAWKMAAIDLAKGFAAAEKPKEKPKQMPLIDRPTKLKGLSPAQKAHIAAAAKARWAKIKATANAKS